MDTSRSPAAGAHPLLPPLILAAVALGVYLITLANGFVWDDGYIIVENPATRSFTSLRDILLSPDIVKPYYRPLNRASYLLDFQLFGMNPAGFHAVNMVLHALNVLLVYLLGRRLFSAGPAALVAALLFAVHPINVETVTFISARNNLFALFFALSCFLAFLRGRDTGGWPWHLAGALLLFLGLMCKETALMVIVPVFLYAIRPFHGTGDRESDLFRPGLSLLPYIAAIAIYLLMRSAALEGVLGTGMAAAELPQRLVRNLYVIPRYLALFLFPAGLTIFHAVPPDWASAPWLVPAWLAIAAGLWLLLRRGGPAARFGLLWLGVNFLPVANIVPIPSYPMAERFMYLPAAGFCLVAGAVLGGPLFDRWGARAAAVRPVGGPGGLGCGGKHHGSPGPGDPRAEPRLARRRQPVRQRGQDRPPFCRGVFQSGLGPDRTGGHGRRPRGMGARRRDRPAPLRRPGPVGDLAARQGDLAGATARYLAAVEANPANVMARYNLGRIYEIQGKPTRAAEQYELFLRYVPVEYGEYVPEVQARLAKLRATAPAGATAGAAPAP
ncbi:glycosyltransferase family 39 protein [Geobacter anodireducens]